MAQVQCPTNSCKVWPEQNWLERSSSMAHLMLRSRLGAIETKPERPSKWSPIKDPTCWASSSSCTVKPRHLRCSLIFARPWFTAQGQVPMTPKLSTYPATAMSLPPCNWTPVRLSPMICLPTIPDDSIACMRTFWQKWRAQDHPIGRMVRYGNAWDPGCNPAGAKTSLSRKSTLIRGKVNRWASSGGTARV